MDNLYCSDVTASVEDSSEDTPMDYIQIHAAAVQWARNKEAKKLSYPSF